MDNNISEGLAWRKTKNVAPEQPDHRGVIAMMWGFVLESFKKLGVPTLDDFKKQVRDYVIADNARTVKGEVRTNAALKLFGKAKFVLRNAIKRLFVQAVMRNEETGRNFIKSYLPAIASVHSSIQKNLYDVKANIIQWDELHADLPIWTVYSFVGRDDNDAPIFEESEIWDMDTFKVFINGQGFLNHVLQWRILHGLKDMQMPRFVPTEGDIGDAVLKLLDRKIESKIKRFNEEGLDAWDFEAFYQGGMTFKDLASDTAGLGAVTAAIGMLVQSYNKVVADIGYNLANARFLAVTSARPGMELRAREFEVFGHDVSIEFDNSQHAAALDPFFIGLDAVEDEVELLQCELRAYLEEWFRLIPEDKAEMAERPYHGGFKAVEGEDGSLTFESLPLEFVHVEPLTDERLHLEKERRKAVAIKLSNEKLVAAETGWFH